MKNISITLLIFLVTVINYSCNQQNSSLQSQEKQITPPKVRNVTVTPEQAQLYVTRLISDPDIVYQWGHEKLHFDIFKVKLPADYFGGAYILYQDKIVRSDGSNVVDFIVRDYEAWERLKEKSADYAEAADYFRTRPQPISFNPLVEFGMPDSTSIGYEIEYESATEGSRKVVWYCYRSKKGTERLSFKSYERIKYAILEPNYLGHYTKSYYINSIEHINMKTDGAIEGHVSTPVLIYSDEITGPDFARVTVVFQDKREVKLRGNLARTIYSTEFTSTKSWTKADIGLKDIK